MRVFIFLSLFLSFSLSVFAQETDPSEDQQPKTFTLNPDDLGALENSVNLFTGQVAFSMNLASLAGRGGLDVAVNIQYNSNVDHLIDVWNVEAPTGILGLGWTMDIPKIVVDNKMTGTRSDDEFYLIEGGQSKKLVCTNAGNYPRTYEVKSPDLWKVEYYYLQEKWVITRENGYQYVFGDQGSNRNTVQWVVRWGNWIGSSVMGSNQEQQAHIWNLSEVVNLWGDKLTFEYDAVEEFVARDLTEVTTHKKHTKASYLKSITGPAGHSVEFTYGEKLYEEGSGRKEYQDPHCEKPEPDAYQEKYETRYLDRLITRGHDGSLLYETALEYDFLGDGSTVKRLLTSIKNIYPSGRSIPPVRFQYFTTGEFVGRMKRVTNSYGAYYEYTYQRSEIPFSDLNITVDAPTPGRWQEHYVYTGSDYVIVVWRTVNENGSHNSDFRPCKIWLYYWDGRWNKQDLTGDGSINIRTREDGDGERILDWQIVLGNYFFAYLRRGTGNQEGSIWYRKESTGGEWHSESITADLESVLLQGNHFVATSSLNQQLIRTFVFTGDGRKFLALDASDEEYEYFASAANNYIFVHNDNRGHQDYVHIFHLTEDKKWTKSSAPSSQLFRTDDHGFRMSYWYASNSFTMGLPWDNEEFIYMWDTNFNNIRRLSGWGRRPDNSVVLSRGNSMLSIAPQEATFANEGMSARFNGSSWQFTPLMSIISHHLLSAGNDVIAVWLPVGGQDVGAFMKVYDPNTSGWKPDVKLTYKADRLSSKGGLRGFVAEVGNDIIVVGDGNYYQRDLAGNWTLKSRLKLGTGEYLVGQSLMPTSGFIAYEYSFGADADPSGSYLAFIKNGEISTTVRYPGLTWQSKSGNHIGHGLFAQVASNTQLILRKVINQRASGKLSAAHVSVLKWYDGNKTFSNSYDYDLSTAKSDPSGTLAYFNKVSVIPGSALLTQRPFGQTDYYFFNGLPADNLAAKPLEDFRNPELLGIGETYQTSVLNSTADTVLLSRIAHSIFRKDIKNSDGETIDVKVFLRQTRSQQMLDSIISETVNEYHNNGLLLSTTMRNSRHYRLSPSGTFWLADQETRSRHLTYWHEVYDPQHTSGYWLYDVVQVKDGYRVSTDFDTLSSSVTRWRTWPNGRRAPDATFGWLRKGNTSFSSWIYPSDPPSDQWKMISFISDRDPVTGAVLESRDASETSQALLYDESRTQVLAQITNGRYAGSAFTSFEGKSKGRWIYDDDDCVDYDSALTGEKVYHSSNPIAAPELDPGVYVLSYWARNGAPEVNVTNGSIIERRYYLQASGWTLYRWRIEVTALPGTISINCGQAMVDELRLHPREASMVSYTYSGRGSIVAETSPNYRITYYVHDDMDRLLAVKDHNGNIVKRYDYRYRNEENYRTALIQYVEPTTPGDTVVFTVSHPDYVSDTTANYQWDLGDGTQVSGPYPEIRHVYNAGGHYRVQVTVVYPGHTDVLISDEKSVLVPDGLAIHARVTGGSDRIISCPQRPNMTETVFTASLISGTCDVPSYQWYFSINGGGAVAFGTAPTAGFAFGIEGEYRVWCQAVSSCGEIVRSNELTVIVSSDRCDD